MNSFYQCAWCTLACFFSFTTILLCHTPRTTHAHLKVVHFILIGSIPGTTESSRQEEKEGSKEERLESLLKALAGSMVSQLHHWGEREGIVNVYLGVDSSFYLVKSWRCTGISGHVIRALFRSVCVEPATLLWKRPMRKAASFFFFPENFAASLNSTWCWRRF